MTEAERRRRLTGGIAGASGLTAMSLQALCLVLRCAGRARVRVNGTSMTPFLKPGDIVEIETCPLYRRGDVVVFELHDALLIHRIVAIQRTSSGQRFIVKGDHLRHVDALQPASDEIIGRLRTIYRGEQAYLRNRKLCRAQDIVISHLSYADASLSQSIGHLKAMLKAKLKRKTTA